MNKTFFSGARRFFSDGSIQILIASVLISFCFAAVGLAQQPSAESSSLFAEGEDIIYNVRYGFIDLGQVRIKTLAREQKGGYTAFRTIAYIDSYRKVPFVDLHAIFESLIDTAVYSRYFLGKTKDGDHWEYARYFFEYDQQKAILEVGYKDTVISNRDTIALNDRCHDGLSLFFFARENLYSKRKVNVPTIIKEKKVTTYIDFKGKRESVEIDAVDHPVDAIRFEGKANFVGLFGLTGDFTGWFSNDAARVPIMAKMKVILGSVTVELMKWKRGSWQPPRGED